jgi:hypothetical protein
MFIFRNKIIGDNDSVCYHWHIVIDDEQIGDAYLDVGRHHQSLSALLYTVANMPESVIETIMDDFKYLANNHLLDVDEDYEPFLFVKVRYYGELDSNPIFY